MPTALPLLASALLAATLVAAPPARAADDDTRSRRVGDGPAQVAAPAPAGRQVAVVVGIDAYAHWPRLKNAVADARGVQEVLATRLGFATPLPPLLDADATGDALRRLVQDRLRSELTRDDSLVLFFAGHGHTVRHEVGDQVVETGYLVPADARFGADLQLTDLVRIDQLLTALSELPARHVLVVLDSCYSGIALGDAVTRTRAAPRFEQDLGARVSRKVISSAHGDQEALDGGPLPGHSLFTGTLIDGLTWGKADLDANGAVTSSELGLYVQQRVGSYSEARQTPDFGAFQLDQRGDLVLSLREGTPQALRAAALAALQRGEPSRFRALVARLEPASSRDPGVLYLEARRALLDRDPAGALETLRALEALELRPGDLPLSTRELRELAIRVRYWRRVLAAPPAAAPPLEVRVLAGPDPGHLTPRAPGPLGELTGYRVAPDEVVQVAVRSRADAPRWVVQLHVDERGSLDPAAFFADPELVYGGLPPGGEGAGYPFRDTGDPGLKELRLLVTPRRVRPLVNPPRPGARGADPDMLEDVDLDGLAVQSVYLSTLPGP